MKIALFWIIAPTLAASLIGVAFFSATAGAALFGIPTLVISVLIRWLVTRNTDDVPPEPVSR